ncbi:hypothetical protein DTO013E5_7230 [Penicillium roqueforti]|uniref:Calycin-like n=1 Tax=Penicillium roqueforti (strain FM164) TaxID=1365484 RepID=W6QPK0_PENRF|nr:uncharacterized protein LCP9604111_5396 [Penicillium roqueforti]CDM37921.1 unnamed protein product [Penicillium roqueforti FM164]KAF9248646.1 hypothetical protein LCP9604111_5396 [Penicillium roqueforti]KAI1832273.1 hypothetical protein CBS147337_6953 [Penicillium roqueforti]KAI2670967.1 hypothetical protein LCP963914a_9726 [Penicillium roqueforti]KAI2671032.1 hypothetical protein CBS147355_8889 [Penicillium roqueforti]
MAAPADITMQNLNGKWEMDSTHSNPTDPILSLQGVGWLIRKTLSYATVTIYITQYADSENPALIHVDAQQVITGGIQGTKEERRLDWEEREHVDHIFGKLKGRSRQIAGTKSEDGAVRPVLEVQTKAGSPEADAKVLKFLIGETLIDGSKSEGFLAEEGEGVFLQSFVQNVESGWTAEQVWGFEIVDGERRHTRRVVVVKDGKVASARLVYAFKERKVAE